MYNLFEITLIRILIVRNLWIFRSIQNTTLASYHADKLITKYKWELITIHFGQNILELFVS